MNKIGLTRFKCLASCIMARITFSQFIYSVHPKFVLRSWPQSVNLETIRLSYYSPFTLVPASRAQFKLHYVLNDRCVPIEAWAPSQVYGCCFRFLDDWRWGRRWFLWEYEKKNDTKMIPFKAKKKINNQIKNIMKHILQTWNKENCDSIYRIWFQLAPFSWLAPTSTKSERTRQRVSPSLSWYGKGFLCILGSAQKDFLRRS